ncbi:hypothetical protein ACNVED_00595 [Legionella sp. D16C41]|uniref:hypothetical protein n=1 Tax=Legionella sp. D16C41 TaxID=3402688 RepID=UPI003AF5E69D
MNKLLLILGTMLVLPLSAYAELQPPTANPAQNDTVKQTEAFKNNNQSAETAQKSKNKDGKDGKVTDANTVSDDSPAGPILPPTNNLNDSPGP